MEKEDNFSAAMPPSFNELDYSAATAHHHHHNHHLMMNNNDNNMVDYMLNNPNHEHPQPLYHHQEEEEEEGEEEQDYGQHAITTGNNNTFSSTLDGYHLPGVLGNNRFMAGSFADVMQFAEFGPKLALNASTNDDVGEHHSSNTAAVNYFLKFPVLNDNLRNDHHHQFPFDASAATQQQEQFLLSDHNTHNNNPYGSYGTSDQSDHHLDEEADGTRSDQIKQLNFLSQSSNSNNNNNTSAMVTTKGAESRETAATNSTTNNKSGSNKRKRPRTVKTTEEVESQRMIHIAVERNRRKQMNEHLRVLRALMPSSYVQRGDQASIIGGAIEFVRELEQLLQCLESQKRRRLYGDSGATAPPVIPPVNPSPSYNQPNDNDDDEEDDPQQQLAAAALAANNKAMLLHNSNDHQLDAALAANNKAMLLHNSNDHELDAALAANNKAMLLHELDAAVVPPPQPQPPIMLLGLREETAESKSCVADVVVKVLGFDALIKILSRRRPGQLISAISALQDLQFSILHTNITTIEQTVLYSFNVKIQNEQSFTADDIATSVQQIFTFIHANNTSL